MNSIQVYFQGSPEEQLVYLMDQESPLELKSLGQSYVLSDGKNDFRLGNNPQRSAQSVLSCYYEGKSDQMTHIMDFFEKHDHIRPRQVNHVFGQRQKEDI